MINKRIHLCWFGKKAYPQIMLDCIDSIKNKLPDYEISIWNEESFDVNMYKFTKEAYSVGKYAFVSDVCRLYVLQQYGGIYLDTDTEVVKNLDVFLKNDFFMGFESDNRLCTSTIGAVASHPLINMF